MMWPTTAQIPQPSFALAGAFQKAHDFVLYNPFMVEVTGDNFMEKLATFTIQGAELDSSERDPPPRCHPGTRKEIIDRIQFWLHSPYRERGILWLVGPAGVGKSAIMQTVAELESSPTVLATLFFSAPNRRNDPHRVVTTLAYQIAVQHQPYRDHIRKKITANPKIMEKSITGQFSEFFVEPFAKRKIYQGPKPFLVFLDGLDECKGEREQRLILALISYFTMSYPSAPLLWVIASRPEAHITEFLTHRKLVSCYHKEEVSIDSNEACRDVERFLREQFERIRNSNVVIQSFHNQWPPEYSFVKLAGAAVGLFAYAATIIRFIGDLTHGDPISRLELVIDLIDHWKTSSSTTRPDTTRPMDQLYNLYRHILSRVAPDDLPHAQEILAFVIFSSLRHKHLVWMCAWIGMAPHVAYRALRQLHSVAAIPSPSEAREKHIIIHHKSFSDFLCDYEMSGMSLGTQENEKHRDILRAIRIFKDIPQSQPEPFTTLPNPSQYVIPLWSDNGSSSSLAKLRKDIYDDASMEVSGLSSLADLPLPDLVHALAVMDPGKLSRFFLPLVFDGRPELVQLLKQSRILCDVSTSLLNMDLLRANDIAIYIIDQGIHRHAKFSEIDRYHKAKILCFLEYVKTHSLNALVTVFFGSRDGDWGWVLCEATIPTQVIPEAVTYCFQYRFDRLTVQSTWAKLEDAKVSD